MDGYEPPVTEASSRCT